jgi:hypothetical protein
MVDRLYYIHNGDLDKMCTIARAWLTDRDLSEKAAALFRPKRRFPAGGAALLTDITLSTRGKEKIFRDFIKRQSTD